MSILEEKSQENIHQTDLASSDDGNYTANEKKTFWQKHKNKLWDTLDKSPKERNLLFKVDWWILSYACLGYFLKTLDQTNVSNAYVSGMKEAMHFHGNQYNLLGTMYTIGYIIGQIPSQFILTKVRPSVWLPTMELIWGVLCMLLAAAPHDQRGVKYMYAFRFLIGLCESTAYAGLIGLLGSWYTPQELGKRSGIFQISSSASNMFSGYLQAGLYKHMNGVHGLKAFQWLFIFDGILTIPIALYGFFAIPDSPENSKAWWLSQEERELCLSRMRKVGRKPRQGITWKTIWALLYSWPVYLFSICFICHVVGIKLYSYMNLWLKSTHKYSVSRINVIPTGGYALQIVCTIIMSWSSDIIGKRYPLIVTFCGVTVIGAIILTVWPDNTNALFAGWYLLFCETGCGILFMSWINEANSHSAEQRFICVGVVEAMAFTFQAWLPLIIFNTGKAPKFGSGYPVTLALFIVEAIGACIIAFVIHLESNGFRWFLSPKNNDLTYYNPKQAVEGKEEINTIDVARSVEPV